MGKNHQLGEEHSPKMDFRDALTKSGKMIESLFEPIREPSKINLQGIHCEQGVNVQDTFHIFCPPRIYWWKKPGFLFTNEKPKRSMYGTFPYMEHLG